MQTYEWVKNEKKMSGWMNEEFIIQRMPFVYLQLGLQALSKPQILTLFSYNSTEWKLWVLNHTYHSYFQPLDVQTFASSQHCSDLQSLLSWLLSGLSHFRALGLLDFVTLHVPPQNVGIILPKAKKMLLSYIVFAGQSVCWLAALTRLGLLWADRSHPVSPLASLLPILSFPSH